MSVAPTLSVPTAQPPRRSVPTPNPGGLLPLPRQSGSLAWRGIVKTVNSPEALIDVTLQPVIFLLLFVYVFGGAISGDTSRYLQFALPGVLVQTVVFASVGTGINLADDRHSRIFDRFRSLPISRAAPLLGAIMVIMPLTFGSNVFVPASTMPGWLRGWAEINPVSRVADTVRGLYLGGPVVAPLLGVLGWAAAIMAVFAPLAVALYRRRA